jgi:O-antigen/teichoic acid export membrane protein
MEQKLGNWRSIINTNVIVMVSARFFTMLLGFLNNTLTARFLGPEGRGQFFLVNIIAATIVQFGILGLQAGNIYQVAGDQAVLGGMLANSVWVSLAVTGGATMVVLICQEMKWFPNLPPGYLWFAVAFVLPTLFYQLGSSLLIGVNRIKTYTLFEVGNRLSSLFFLVGASLFAASVGGFLTAGFTASLIVVIVLFVLLMSSYGDGLKFRVNLFRSILPYAIKAHLVALLGFLVLRSNVFLLQRFCNMEQVGYYSVSSGLADSLGILPASFALVLFPKLVQEKRDRLNVTLRCTLIIGIFMLVISILVAIFSKVFITAVFGPRFIPAVSILLWMLPGVIFLSMSCILSQYLAAIGFPRLLIGIWFFVLIIAIILGWFLIPVQAGIGVAWSYSISYMVLFFMILGFIWFTKYKKVDSTNENL